MPNKFEQLVEDLENNELALNKEKKEYDIENL